MTVLAGLPSNPRSERRTLGVDRSQPLSMPFVHLSKYICSSSLISGLYRSYPKNVSACFLNLRMLPTLLVRMTSVPLINTLCLLKSLERPVSVQHTGVKSKHIKRHTIDILHGNPLRLPIIVVYWSLLQHGTDILYGLRSRKPTGDHLMEPRYMRAPSPRHKMPIEIRIRLPRR